MSSQQAVEQGNGGGKSSNLIEPRVLKGFRDTLPNLGILRERMIHSLTTVFSTFGFAPIDTPALEYAEILLGKGSDETDKQLFRFADQGGRDVALRFDLTVPLARFVAMHISELGTPFRRYHVAPVWRAEKPQRGRYREFIQCDFDIIGSTSMSADAEVLLVTHTALNALGIEHQLRLNNRQILSGLVTQVSGGAADGRVKTAVLRAIDKIEKLGAEVVRAELKEEAKLESAEVDAVIGFLSLCKGKTPQEAIGNVRSFFSGNEEALRGVDELSQVITILSDAGVADSSYEIDVSIARGLDYYTGTVAETRMLALPEIGSICSGGRYNNLAGLYTKRELPGVGLSIGLDRILGAYEALGKLPSQTTPAIAYVAVLDEGTEGVAMKLAQTLRSAGIPTEVALGVQRLGNQLKYADKKGIPFAVICGKDEASRGVCVLKNLTSGEQKAELPWNEVAQHLHDFSQAPGLA